MRYNNLAKVLYISGNKTIVIMLSPRKKNNVSLVTQ